MRRCNLWGEPTIRSLKTNCFLPLHALALWLVLTGTGGSLLAQQPYFNEWYHAQNSYIKIKVARDGLYRLTKADMRAIGVHNTHHITSSNIQVFYRGVEIPIYTHDSASGGFDYLEFVGHRNDGAIDSLLYRSNVPPFPNDPSLQGNGFSSFYTDTSAYFVTWDNVGTQRMQTLHPQNFQAHMPEPWYRHQMVFEFDEAFFEGGGGSNDIWNVLNPDWVTGEGLVSQSIVTPSSIGDALSQQVVVKGFANSGNPSRVEARILGINNVQNHIFALDINQVNQYTDTLHGVSIGTFGFDYALPLPPTTFIRLHAYGDPNNKITATWYSLAYDRTFDLEDTTFTVIKGWNHPDTTYLRFYRAKVDTAAWLYDLVERKRIEATVVGDTLKFLVPGSPHQRDLHVFTDRALQLPTVDPVPEFAGLGADSAGAEFVIIAHRKFQNSAQQYATYRNTDTTHRFLTKVVYIEELYNEFGYGSMTPWAIKNFCRYALENWPTKPQHFMIWGKGRNCPKCAGGSVSNYIPVFGTPANDLEYVTNLDRNVLDLVPKAGMGRVSIVEDAQGLVYLEKVKLYEHMPYKPWVKETMFIGGGENSSQQNAIFSYLMSDTSETGSISVEGFNSHWVNPPLNGTVWWHQKRGNGFESNDALTTEQRINAGIGLMQYFGHSSVNIFELDILEPNLYKNDSMYPLMMAYGCSGGNYYTAAASYGERFILEPQKGGIGYVGNTTSGFLTDLGQYGQDFYSVFLDSQYGQPLGDVFKAALAKYTSTHSATTNIHAANHAKQMNLQGDPSIALRLPVKADLRIRPEDVYFPDGFPGALDPEFRLNVILHNDGRSFEDSFQVTVTHYLPGSATPAYHDTLTHAPIALRDTLELVLRNTHGLLSAGYNQFSIQVDPLDTLDEYYENNNEVQVQQLFLGKLATPVAPPEFAIVSDATIALIASTYQMLPSGPIRYSFEIDTVPTFDSPFKKTSPVVVGNSAIGEWPIPFAMTPGQVYYWRSRMTDHYPEQWIASSYKYIPGRTGWSQGEIPQLLKNTGDHLHLNETSQQWEFDLKSALLHATIITNGTPGKAAYFLDIYSSSGDANHGVLYTPFDQQTLVPRFMGPGLYGDWRYAQAPSPSSHDAITDIATTVAAMKQGDYFLMVSSGNPAMNHWPDPILHALEMVGGNFAQLRAMTNGQRLIFLGQKGKPPGSATLISQPNLTIPGQSPMYDVRQTLSAPLSEGNIRSTVIGPTTNWREVGFDWATLEPFTADSSSLSVYGIRKDGTEQLLISHYAGSARNLADVRADSFPSLRLVNHAKDRANHTPPQLQQWEVYFDPVADLAIDANLGLIMPDTLEEGQITTFRYGIRNLTSQLTDSVLVRYSLQAADRSLLALGERRYGPFEAREIRQLSHTVQTAAVGLEEGLHTLIIEVNPDHDQAESNHFNNFYYHRVWVNTDGVGPLVDVTVDGKHLITGDIVSPDPEIVIQVNDDNHYLPVAVSDSTYRIWFGTERSYRTNPTVPIDNNLSIEKVPVRMPENKSRLVFKPGKLVDGEYTLAVQGYDANGNAASGEPYIIQMNVVNQKALSDVLPYPNPFSSACHFVFTLTGEELPSRFEIEIYTITGKLVKVVDLLGLGEVHIGYNITRYAWDGRDEFGDQLANGVYLYRVNARFANGANIDKRDEGISGYFNNGFGKMYLMR